MYKQQELLLTFYSSCYDYAHVTNTSTAHPRSNSYYREVDFANITFTDTAFHGTYALAIVPQLYGTDTVQASQLGLTSKRILKTKDEGSHYWLHFIIKKRGEKSFICIIIPASKSLLL